jgi:PAS domain S-box-containing protein
VVAAREPGWPALFSAAFSQSRNAMSLVDSERRLLEVNGAYLKLLGHSREAVIGRPISSFVAHGPLATPAQWAAELADGRATGQAELLTADGSFVGVQWAATTEVVTGRRLVLFVALSTSRWGHRFRPLEGGDPRRPGRELTRREREVVGLVAVGGTATEIADELHISHHTVRTHLRNAMDKLGARSRAHLVAKALGHGLALEGQANIPQPRYRKAAATPPA